MGSSCNQKFMNSHFCTCIVKIWLQIALNAIKLSKFLKWLTENAENNGGKRFVATFMADVILRMRRELFCL